MKQEKDRISKNQLNKTLHIQTLKGILTIKHRWLHDCQSSDFLWFCYSICAKQTEDGGPGQRKPQAHLQYNNI